MYSLLTLKKLFENTSMKAMKFLNMGLDFNITSFFVPEVISKFNYFQLAS